jgi:hypothetical protein
MQLPHKELAAVKQTPRGSVVVLGDRLLTDELPAERAYDLAITINHRLLDENHGTIIAWT